MASEVMDWDNAYKGQSVFEGPPPWNIGEAQPELATLLREGRFRSDVLDAGCGVAELSLTLASEGYTVVGLDLTPTAIAAATRAAEERCLTTASFAQADITDFGQYPPGSEGRFATVVDSTLFHSLPVDGRDDYLKAVHRAAAPGGSFFVLVFAKGAFPAEFDRGPNEVDEKELRAAVGKYWEIDTVRRAVIHANMPDFPGGRPWKHPRDDRGRVMMPAYLLTAHKAG